MTEGIPRYPVEGLDEDELLTDNELGIAEAINQYIGVGVGVLNGGGTPVTRQMLKDGKEISMKEVHDMLADAYEEKEAS